MPVPRDRPLPIHVTTWAVQINGVQCTYGDVHEMMHRDIAAGNEFRKERIKLLIAVASGVFALMVSFNKDLFSSHTSPAALVALLVGFILLLISILCGILHFKAWEDFYLAYRGPNASLWKYRALNGDPAGQARATRDYNDALNKIEWHRGSYKHWDMLQTAFLLLGLSFVVVYVGLQAMQTGRETAAPHTQAQNEGGRT